MLRDKPWYAVAAILLAPLGGIVLTAAVGRIFDALNLPVFHTWGLMHGGFVVVLPVLTLLTWLVLRRL